MKKYFTLLGLLVITTSLIGQTQKTYVKSFTWDFATVLLELEGEVEVQEWDEPIVRVHTTVSLDDGSLEVLKSLMLAGRYRVVLDRLDQI